MPVCGGGFGVRLYDFSIFEGVFLKSLIKHAENAFFIDIPLCVYIMLKAAVSIYSGRSADRI